VINIDLQTIIFGRHNLPIQIVKVIKGVCSKAILWIVLWLDGTYTTWR
jgi:hypothetical protein